MKRLHLRGAPGEEAEAVEDAGRAPAAHVGLITPLQAHVLRSAGAARGEAGSARARAKGEGGVAEAGGHGGEAEASGVTDEAKPPGELGVGCRREDDLAGGRFLRRVSHLLDRLARNKKLPAGWGGAWWVGTGCGGSGRAP